MQYLIWTIPKSIPIKWHFIIKRSLALYTPSFPISFDDVMLLTLLTLSEYCLFKPIINCVLCTVLLLWDTKACLRYLNERVEGELLINTFKKSWKDWVLTNYFTCFITKYSQSQNIFCRLFYEDWQLNRQKHILKHFFCFICMCWLN